MNLKLIKAIKILFIFFLLIFKTTLYFSQSSRTSSFGYLKKDILLFQNKMGIQDILIDNDSLKKNGIFTYPVDKRYTDYKDWLNANKITSQYGTMNIVGDISKFLIVKRLLNTSGSAPPTIERTKSDSTQQVDTPGWENIPVGTGTPSGIDLQTEGLVNNRSIFMRNFFQPLSSSIVINEENIGAYLSFTGALEPSYGTTLNITSTATINIAEIMNVGTTNVLIGPIKNPSETLPASSLEVSGNIIATKIYANYGFSTQNVRTNSLPDTTSFFPSDTNLAKFVIDGTTSQITSGNVNAVGAGAMRKRTDAISIANEVVTLNFTYKTGHSLAVFTTFELFSVYESIFYSTQIVITTQNEMTVIFESQINTHQFEDHNWSNEGYDYTLINQWVYDPVLNSNLLKDGSVYTIRLYAWVSAVENVRESRTPAADRGTFKSTTTYSEECKGMTEYPFKARFASISLLGLPTQ